MSKIFGGSKQQSTSSSSSSNLAYNDIKSSFLPGASSAFEESNDALARELAGGFDTYKKNTSFDFFEKLGLGRMASGFSGRGAFGSGAALKALSNYQSQLQGASYNDYLDKLFQRAQLGVSGGGLVAGSGNTSSSTSQSTGVSHNGMGDFIGSMIGAAAASDRRLKKDIVQLGELSNGLKVYSFKYINDEGPFVGVMADEVKELMPEALGPVIDGYMTVNYDKIKEVA